MRPNDATPLAIIACENVICATDTLAEHIKDPKHTTEHRLYDHHERARYANSVIDRIVPAQNPDAGLDVKLERLYKWVIDGTLFKDHESPAIKGVKWVDDLVPYIERKLYTVNTGHAAAAYWGYNMKSVNFSREKEVRMTCLIILTRKVLTTYNNESTFM